jgi:hypothetical protein
VIADRARLAEALTLLTVEAAAAAGPDAPLTITTVRDGGGASIAVASSPPSRSASGNHGPVGAGRDPGAAILARRLIAVQGGSTDETASGFVVRLRGTTALTPS